MICNIIISINNMTEILTRMARHGCCIVKLVMMRLLTLMLFVILSYAFNNCTYPLMAVCIYDSVLTFVAAHLCVFLAVALGGCGQVSEWRSDGGSHPHCFLCRWRARPLLCHWHQVQCVNHPGTIRFLLHTMRM